MDTLQEDVYLISQNYKVVNTTFQPDIGLDFMEVDSSFKVFFDNIFRGKQFQEDRFSLELKTGRLRKYSYYPVQNGRFIIEIGLYSSVADQFNELLLEKINGLSQRYPSISKVSLYLGSKDIVDVSIKDESRAEAYLRCLRERKTVVIDYDNPQTEGKEQKEFIFLPVMNTKLFDGYVLEVETNDIVFTTMLSELFYFFSILFLAFVVIISLIVYVRSRILTQPITQLAQEAQGITAENLGKQISISGSKEIDELTASFNGMIENLRVSYETLEEKVIERTQQLNEQKKELERKNREIVESIEYARFIQQALLPLESEIQEVFPESFVYYAPKNIIAGDFFWFEQQAERIWFAVADCTGHGVPGALVSVLCINALNQSLSENSEATTGEMLDLVREKVVQTLTKDARSVNDGMDISIGCIDKKQKLLFWSGANNPLWIIRNGLLLVTEPDKQPIGHYEDSKPFKSHEIPLQSNDSIVLFSDGYADQFGGPKNKKYKYASLKNFLLDQQHLAAPEIKQALENEFEAWKGTQEQTDDVCIMRIHIQ
jgi:phosphoserine phosphatase RsbU/P